MRLFFDQYSTGLRCELTVLACDLIAMAAAVLFTVGALEGGGRGEDIALLALWSMLPRGAAVALRIGGRPTHGIRLFVGSLTLLVSALFLLLTGWELIASVAPAGSHFASTHLFMIFSAWCTSFLVFYPRAYRLFDFFLWAMVLLGLKDGRAHAAATLALLFPLFLLSAACRHLRFDIFRSVRAPPMNLRDARVLALLAACLALGIWLPGTSGFRALIGERTRRMDRAPASGGGEPGGAISSLQGGGTEGAAGAMQGPPAPPGGERGRGPEGDTTEARTAGLSYDVGLDDLSMALVDDREVLRVRVGGHRGAEAPGWPQTTTLWKAATFSRFDAERESWIEKGAPKYQDWPADGLLDCGAGESADKGRVKLQVSVVTPVVSSLVLPYSTRGVRATAFAGVFRSGSGDWFPTPPPGAGCRLELIVSPLALGETIPGHGPPTRGDGDEELQEEQLTEIPEPEIVEVDLRALAASVFGADPGPAAERLQKLESFFRDGFRYSRRAAWGQQQRRLASFLGAQRVGNCTYFATASALLLRAAGLPTRLAVGFHGATWDAESGELVIENRRAHAWVEVRVAEGDWRAIDPTSWAPSEPDTALHNAGESPEGAAEDPANKVTNGTGPAAGQPPGGAEGTGAEPPPLVEAQLPATNGVTVAQGAAGRRDTGWKVTSGAGSSRGGPARGGGGGGVQVDPSSLQAVSGPGAAGIGFDVQGTRRPWGTTSRLAMRWGLAAIGVLVLLLAALSYLRPAAPGKGDVKKLEEHEAAGVAPNAKLALDQIDESTTGGRLMAEYLRLQIALVRTRRHRLPHQTPIEHGRAITHRVQAAEPALNEVHRAIYRYAYGHEALSEEAVTKAISACRSLRQLLA